MAPGRVRVLIAGNIYVKRALVRRFLEDDGYEVIGEAMSPSEIVPSVQREQPDVVVIDDDLVETGTVGTIPRIRSAQPDAKIVVFTSGAAPEGDSTAADGYLEKGVALSALTVLLGRLLAEPAKPAPVVPTVEETAEDSAPVSAAATVDSSGTRRADRGRALELAAIAFGLVLIVGGFIALAGRGTSPAPQRATGPSPTPSTVTSQPADDSLRNAYADLDEMVSALRGGNYVLATVDAQALMSDRDAARAAGFSLGLLDQAISARLSSLADTLPARVIPGLEDIFGPLFPTIPTTTTRGTSTTSGASTTSVISTSGSSATSGTSTTEGGGGTSTTGGGGTTNGGGGGTTTTGGGGSTQVLGPGDGRAWGLSHQPGKNGWNGRRPTHHGKPAWAQGPK